MYISEIATYKGNVLIYSILWEKHEKGLERDGFCFSVESKKGKETVYLCNWDKKRRGALSLAQVFGNVASVISSTINCTVPKHGNGINFGHGKEFGLFCFQNLSPTINLNPKNLVKFLNQFWYWFQISYVSFEDYHVHIDKK